MANANFKIKGILSPEQLDITNHGNATIHSNSPFRKVTWKVKTDAVCAIRIENKSGFDPFRSPIPTEFSREVELEVKDKYQESDWIYCISWISAKDGTIHHHDPKISIRSSFLPDHHGHRLSGRRMIGLGLGLLGLALWLTDD